MAISIPFLTESGAPFPARPVLVAVAFGVILVTLMVQGFTLRPLIKRFALPRGDTLETEERRARIEAEQAAMKTLDEIGGLGTSPPTPSHKMREAVAQRTRLDLDDTDHSHGQHRSYARGLDQRC